MVPAQMIARLLASSSGAPASTSSKGTLTTGPPRAGVTAVTGVAVAGAGVAVGGACGGSRWRGVAAARRPATLSISVSVNGARSRPERGV